jgi:hypothetical protein
VVLVGTDVSEKCISIIGLTRIGELGTKLFIASNRSTLRRNTIVVILMMEEICSYETSVLSKVTRLNTTVDGSLHSQGHENLKS